MYYGNIKNCDISNGEGVRISLFVSGCTNHCRGCFQPETWDFKYGSPFTPKVQDDILNMLAPSYIDGPFDIDQSDISLRFRGSRNQRIIDVPPTLKQGHIVFYDEVAHHPWMTQHSHF